MQDFLNIYVLAMESEAKELIIDAKLISKVPLLFKKNNDLILITGIGKTNASFALSYVLAKYQVSNIINLGFVGAFGDFNIGDKVLVKNAKYHDFDLSMFNYEKGQVPGLPASYESNKSLLNKLNIGYKEALLLTGDYFQTNPIDINFISDMEGAALFQVAHLLNKNIISIKVVSDVIGKENHLEEYKKFESNGSSYILEIYEKIKGGLID